MNNISNMNNEFKEINISDKLIESLDILKYTSPTQIQREVLPFALEGKNIVAKSQTGSGKTAAFAIPLCEFAIWEHNEPEALVLEPTRELTVQVKQEIFNIGRLKRLKVADLVGGFPIEKQLQTLKQKNHIVVGTPGRVLDHFRRGTLKPEYFKYLVIDEADLMLDMGFMEEVGQILEKLPSKRQIMLFSATIQDSIETLVNQYMNEPVRINIESDTKTVGTVTQSAVSVQDKDDKYDVFRSLLIEENPDSAMIFCGTREMVNVLCRRLRKDGVKCGMIHGEIDQSDRLRTIADFRDGRIRFLIATDVAARGIDFENMTHVFNYDFPTGKEVYVHRIGRTGRNGASGTAVSLITADDLKMRTMVEKYINMSIPDRQEVSRTILQQNGKETVFLNRQREKIKQKPRRDSGFAVQISRLSIGGGKKSKMRTGDIVGAICSIDGVEQGDIGMIDVRDSLTYVEILNAKGELVLEYLQNKTIKGKVRKVRRTK